MTAHVSPDAPRPPVGIRDSGGPMPFNEADFTRDVRKLMTEGDRVPTQRAEEDAPYGWYNPDWVRVETTIWAHDGSVTRSVGWVRREEWFRSGGDERMGA